MKKLILILLLICTPALGYIPTEEEKHGNKQVICLAKNIMFEARGEGHYGRLAVGAVTMNRAVKRRQSVCKTVYEHRQFSWTHQLSRHRQYRIIEREYRTWRKILKIASNLYYDENYRDQSPVGASDHYLNPTALKRLPRWYTKYSYNRIRVGRHVFVMVRRRG